MAGSRRAVAAVGSRSAPRRVQLAVGDLQPGMWVAELDRPWLDTPFLLQGFLIDSQVELETLRKYCRHVYVDTDQSSPELIEDIRQAEQRIAAAAAASDATSDASTAALIVLDAPSASAGSGRGQRVFRARADVRISDGTRERFRELVRTHDRPDDEPRLLARALGWLRKSGGTASAARRGAEAAVHGARWLPAGTQATAYLDTLTMEEALPAARRAYADASEVLRESLAEVRAGKTLQAERVRAAVATLVQAMVANPDALSWLARLRDDDLAPHHQGIKVALYMIALARHLGLPEAHLSHAGMIGLLADLGKARLPRALLEKPGMLSPSEFSIVKDHVQLTLDVLAAAGIAPEVWMGIAQHHERLDGSGYPQGLRGDAIGLWGRMGAIADSFAALTTPRPYANPSPPQDALMNLYEWVGTSFDEALVEQFVQAVGVFPVGSLVELSTGEVAVVIAQSRTRRLEPRLLVLTWPDKSPLPLPRERDLAIAPRDGRVVRIVRGLAAGAYGLKLRDYHLGDIDREIPLER